MAHQNFRYSIILSKTRITSQDRDWTGTHKEREGRVGQESPGREQS
jgi:hypothetical protein